MVIGGGRTSRRTRRAFSLVEGLVSIVVLSIAVPVSVMMMSDASSARASSLQRERAVHLMRLLRNEIVADVAAPSHGLGIAVFEDVDAYEDDLRARIATRVATYEELGYAWSIDAGAFVGPRGVFSGVPETNIYRPVTLTVEWTDARNGAESLGVTLYLTEVGA